MIGGDPEGRTRFIEHEGHRMLLLDFSGIRDAVVALAAIAEARALVGRQPLGSLLTITCVKGSAFMPSVVGALQELARHDGPYTRAAAVAGMSGIQRVAFAAIELVSGRSFKVCRDVAEAKRWLAAHDANGAPGSGPGGR